MRDTLPKNPRKNESAIINLDSGRGSGTHWVCYKKRGNIVYYFDSFGDLRPPVELTRYLGPAVRVKYNFECKQRMDSVICGHLCLQFLSKNVLS